MSEFHYVRTLGRDGGVDAVNGPAVGVGLDQILEDGLPPFKIALEIIAALCEILDIADEDGELHGSITPGFIFVDDTGAVSIEGFGEEHETLIAPETDSGHLADLYCLGRVAVSMLSPKNIDAPIDSPDAHDDAIIDTVIGMNFDGMPEEIVGDIQWYLAKLLAFEPEDRPSAIDVWRSFIAFADTVEGPLLEDWAPEAINGGGERRDAAEAAKAPTPPPPQAEEDEEDLDGPVMMSGPLKKGGLNLGGGGAKAGQATAFWSRDQMKAALEAQDEEGEEEAGGGGGGFRPQAAAATAFWSKSDMQDASRPKRKQGGNAPKKEEEPAADWGKPAAAPPPAASSAPPQPPIAAATAAPASPPPVIQGPQNALPEPEEASGGGGGKIAAIGAVLVFGLLCLGGLGAGGAYFAFSGDDGGSSGTTTPEVEAPEATTPPPPPPPTEAGGDTGSAGKDEKKDEPKKEETKKSSSSSSSSGSVSGSSAGTPTDNADANTRKSSTRSSSSSSSSSGSGTRPSSTRSSSTRSSSGSSTRPSSTRPSSTTTTASAAPSGGFKVTFKGNGQGKIICGDGKQVDFDGTKQLNFEGPTSCRVDMADGTSGAQYLESSGTCQVTSPMLTCN